MSRRIDEYGNSNKKISEKKMSHRKQGLMVDGIEKMYQIYKKKLTQTKRKAFDKWTDMNFSASMAVCSPIKDSFNN